MARRKPPNDETLRTAAEARAGGQSWDRAAAIVGYAASAVRLWPIRYAARWAAVLREAELRLVSEASAEAIHTLRKQLRSEDDKAAREAAKMLLALRQIGEKLRAEKPGDAPPLSSEARDALEYLESPEGRHELDAAEPGEEADAGDAESPR